MTATAAAAPTLPVRQNLAAAILRVVDSRTGWAPYFGAVLRGLVRREMPEAMVEAMRAEGMAPTLAVTEDGILFWAAEFVRTTPTETLALGLIHECMHVVLKHHERCRALRVPQEMRRLANLAEDACINEEIRKLKQPPETWCYPETLHQPLGLTFEERYRLIEKNTVTIKVPRCGGGGCGSCSGNSAPGEPPPGKKDGEGGGEGRSKAEMDRIRREVAQAVQAQEARDSQSRGFLPASLARWAEEFLAPPQVPWQDKLASVVRAAVAYRPGAVDFDWSKPSRRQGGLGYGVGVPIVPSYRAPVPQVGVLIDLSGSMSRARVKAATSELQGILAAVNATVTVCTVDAELQGIKECRSLADAAEIFTGGGSTILTPGFEALSARQPKIELVVVLTDAEIGDGYPDIEPHYRVVWCVCGNRVAFKPRYGEVIHVEAPQ